MHLVLHEASLRLLGFALTRSCLYLIILACCEGVCELFQQIKLRYLRSMYSLKVLFQVRNILRDV